MRHRFALLGVIFVSSFTVKLKQGFRSEFLTFLRSINRRSTLDPAQKESSLQRQWFFPSDRDFNFLEEGKCWGADNVFTETRAGQSYQSFISLERGGEMARWWLNYITNEVKEIKEEAVVSILNNLQNISQPVKDQPQHFLGCLF